MEDIFKIRTLFCGETRTERSSSRFLKATVTELPTSPVQELSHKHAIKLFPQAALRLTGECHPTATRAANKPDTSAHAGNSGHSHLPDCPSSFTEGHQVQEHLSDPVKGR